MHRNATNTARPPSLIETLGTGFRALNQALPALLVPLLLNVWYWLGPRISLRPLVDWLRAALGPALWKQLRDQLGPTTLSEQIFDLKFVGRLEGLLPFWQRIYTFEPAGALPQWVRPAIWNVGGFLTLIGAAIAINSVLTLLTAIYLVPLADVVRGAAAPHNWFQRVGRAWLAQLAVMGIVLILLSIIGIPLLVVAGVLVNIFPLLGNFVAVFAVVALLWVIFTASFAYDAIVVSGAGPISAILTSLLIIRKSFWSAVRLYLLSLLILAGLNIIWRSLTGSPLGLIVAMLSSAYIGAGLAAAHLVFYHDRLPASAAQPTGA